MMLRTIADRPQPPRPGRVLAGIVLWTALASSGAAVAATEAEIAAAKRAASQPAHESPIGQYLAAFHAQRQHDYGRAATFILRTLAVDPERPEVLRRAFQLLVSEGRVAEAVPYAETLLDEDRTSSLAALVLAVDAAKQGDAERARTLVDRTRGGAVLSLVQPMLRAWLLVGGGDVEAALAEIEPLAGRRGLETIAILHSALLADLGERSEDARRHFQRLAELSERPPVRVVRHLANFLIRDGRPAEAREHLDRFTDGGGDPLLVADLVAALAGPPPARSIQSANDGLAEALLDVASAVNQPRSRDLALLLSRLALHVRSDLSLARLLVGTVLEGYERHAAAERVFSQIPESSPVSWTARLRIAAARDRGEDVDGAIAILRQMIAERPDRHDAAIQLGDLLRARSRFDEAVQAYDTGIARMKAIGEDDWSMLYARGIALERAKDWPRAEEDFQRALELQPDQPYVLNYLAYSWIEMGQHLDRSLAMLEKAVAQRPNDGYIVDSLGWVLYRLGRYGEAVVHLERAVELRPLDPVINDHLGDAYWRTGRRTEARIQWQRALSLKPEPDQVEPIERKLTRGLGEPPKKSDGG